MTIIIDETILWILLGIAVWLFLGVWGLLMGNAAVRERNKWAYANPVIFCGAISFIAGFWAFFFSDWDK